MQKADLSIIIVSYNTRFWLKQTLESLQDFYLKKTKFKVEVVVVDNNSEDDSTNLIKRSFKWVKLIELKENLGFAAANNVAIKKSNSNFIMLLNSDTQLTNDSNLDILLEAMKQDEKIGAITPQLVLPNGEVDPACHRGEPTLWASFTYFSGLEKIFPKIKLFSQYHQRYLDYNSIHEVEACSGAAMIVSQKAIQQVGLLDENFFMYAEDLDWCKRFREAGFKIIYYPLIKLIHHKHKSGIKSNFKAKRKQTKHHFYDTMLTFYDKHYAKKHPKFVKIVLNKIIEIKKGVS